MAEASLYLLDTNVISHLMREPKGVVAQRYTALLKGPKPPRMVTSLVVQCELLYGLAKTPSPRLHTAYDLQLQQLPVLHLDEGLPSHYAALRTQLERAGIALGANDLLIAAHAIAVDATLVSADTAFARVPGLKVENWLN